MIRFFLVLISALQPVISGDDGVVLNVTGTVGGVATFTCASYEPQADKYIYFQKKNQSGGDEIFVNGFHKRPLSHLVKDEYKNRTIVHPNNGTLNLSDLTPSDQGEYKCIQLQTPESKYTFFHLTITANYTVPTVTVQDCRHGNHGPISCELGCWAWGGYPRAGPSWTLVTGHVTVLQNSDHVSSGVWNVSQTVTINCTRPNNITCTVGGVTSPPISICKHSSPPENSIIVIVACVVVLFVLILALILGLKTSCRRQRTPDVEPGVQLPLKPAEQNQPEDKL